MKRKQKGVTLIELIVVMAIMGTVFSTIYMVLNSGILLYNNGMKIENIETNGRQTMEMLSQKLKTSKSFVQTTDMKGTIGARFNELRWSDGTVILEEDRVAYVEDCNKHRYIYALKTNNGAKELHQLTLIDQKRQEYEVSTPLIMEKITENDEIAYGLDPQNLVKYLVGDVVLKTIPLDCIPYKLLYENYGEKCFLLATKNGEKFKMNLSKLDNNDFKIKNDSVIATHIEQVTTVNEGSTAKINIKIKDKDKNKEITTNVFILNSKDEF